METRIQGFSQLCNRTVTMTIFMVRVEGEKRGGGAKFTVLKGRPMVRMWTDITVTGLKRQREYHSCGVGLHTTLSAAVRGFAALRGGTVRLERLCHLQFTAVACSY